MRVRVYVAYTNPLFQRLFGRFFLAFFVCVRPFYTPFSFVFCGKNPPFCCQFEKLSKN